MHLSALVVALSSSIVFAQGQGQGGAPSISVQFQHFTGVADFLGSVQAQLPTGYASLAQEVIPVATKVITSIFPGATSIGGLESALSNPGLMVPALAYAQIPPNILDGPEYYLALNAAPQVLSIVGQDLATFLGGFPSTLAMTDLASYASVNSDAVGSAVSALINTAIPQARQILTSLESETSSIAIPSSTNCVATPSAAVTSSAVATGSPNAPTTTQATVTGSATTSRGPATTSIGIATGAASTEAAGKGLVIKAFMVGFLAVVATLF